MMLKNPRELWHNFKNFFSKANPPKTVNRDFLFSIGPYSEKHWQEPISGRMDIGEEANQKIAVLGMCIGIRQDSISSVRLKLMRKKGKAEAEEVTNHPLMILLEDVNPFETSRDLKAKTSAYLDLTGNCFWFFDNYIGNTPYEIWVPRPSFVRIIPDKKKFIKGYEYWPLGYQKGQPRIFEPEKVLHFKTFNPVDQYYGAPPLLSGSTELATDFYAGEYQINFFKHGAVPSKTFKLKGFTEEKLKEWLEKWWNKYGGVSMSHQTAFITEDMEEVSTGPTMKDMEFNILRKFTREVILGLYRVPPMLAGIFEYANYANSREQRKLFWQDGIIPRLNQLKVVLDQILIPRFEKNPQDFFFEWDLSNVEALQETSEERNRNAVLLYNAGLAKLNEARGMVNLLPVDEKENTFKPIAPSLFDLPPDNPDSLKKILEAPSFERIPERALIKANGGKNQIQFKIGNTIFKTESLEIAGGDEKVSANKTEMLDTLWKKMDVRLQGQEQLFLKDLQSFFAKQKKRVLKRFDEEYPSEKAPRPLSEQTLEIIFKRIEEDKEIKKAILQRFELIMEFAGQVASEDVGAFIDLNLANPRVEGFMQLKEALAVIINDTTSESIRLRILNAIEKGMSTKDLRDDLVGLFGDISEGRALNIAQTETTGAYNFGTLEAWKQSGVVQKKWWLSARDLKVRQSHLDMETATIDNPIPIDSYFANGLMFPGDQSGPAEEVINCRCTMQSISSKE